MSTATATHPVAPETRTIDVDVKDIDTRGRMLVGYAAVYGAQSADLGGFTESIQAGAFAGVMDADVRALLNHDPSQVLGRTRSGTLRLSDEERGLRFEVDLPSSPLGDNVREAVKRGDIDGASFRFIVGEETWDGDKRSIITVKDLQDVTVATYGAYPAASVELRTRPESPTTSEEDTTMNVEDRTEGGGGLAVVDRAQTTSTPTIEERIADGLRSVPKGEARSLTGGAAGNAGPITPPELSTFLWDRLRPASIALASGIVVIPTGREKVTWPRLISDVDPTWIAQLDLIPEGPPGFGTLDAEPKKLAHRITDIANEVIDDSEPGVVGVLSDHMLTMLGLKLDYSIFESNQATNPKAIKGLKYVTGIQTISMGTDGAALTNWDPFVRAVGRLRAANVPGPYAIAGHPDVLTELELLKELAGSNVQLPKPDGLPAFYTSSQLSTVEAQGTSSSARSAYVYAPQQLVLVRRADATVELDRSRLFDKDASEMRSTLRADLIVPNPVAVVRITGITPPA